jgi:hypothetical protein
MRSAYILGGFCIASTQFLHKGYYGECTRGLFIPSPSFGPLHFPHSYPVVLSQALIFKGFGFCLQTPYGLRRRSNMVCAKVWLHPTLCGREGTGKIIWAMNHKK